MPFIFSSFALSEEVGVSCSGTGNLKSEGAENGRAFFEENSGKEDENSEPLSAMHYVVGGLIIFFTAYFGSVFFLRHLIKNKLCDITDKLLKFYEKVDKQEIPLRGGSNTIEKIKSCEDLSERLLILDRSIILDEDIHKIKNSSRDFFIASTTAGKICYEVVSEKSLNLLKLIKDNKQLKRMIANLGSGAPVDACYDA